MLNNFPHNVMRYLHTVPDENKIRYSQSALQKKYITDQKTRMHKEKNEKIESRFKKA